MASLDDRIESLATKLKQAKALKQKREARERAMGKKKERADDNRRKILLGALYLQKIEADDALASQILSELDQYLTRDDDRALFGLEPKRGENNV